jgi:pimeloyl-ACP methyl ester carboxylesterase
MAGTVISGVAEQRPEQIERLVYLCAFLVPDGQSLFGIAQSDSQSLILPNLVINEAEGYTTVDSPARRAAFYNDCRDEDAEWALARLCTDPIGPVMTPLQLSAERFGRVPRTYIICTQDQAIGPDHQRMMEAGLPCHSVIELDAGHSPFISQPEALAGQLLNLAAPAPVSA